MLLTVSLSPGLCVLNSIGRSKARMPFSVSMESSGIHSSVQVKFVIVFILYTEYRWSVEKRFTRFEGIEAAKWLRMADACTRRQPSHLFVAVCAHGTNSFVFRYIVQFICFGASMFQCFSMFLLLFLVHFHCSRANTSAVLVSVVGWKATTHRQLEREQASSICGKRTEMCEILFDYNERCLRRNGSLLNTTQPTNQPAIWIRFAHC